MYLNLLLAVCSVFALSRMCHGVSADNQCPAQEPIYWKALKGYTFKTLLGSSLFECLYHRHYEVRCQSYNYVIKNDICEMNNRTKEAKPEQFVSDSDRFYMKRGAHRVVDFCIQHCCLQNGALCVNGHLNYTCMCDVHWTGIYCEMHMAGGWLLVLNIVIGSSPPSQLSVVTSYRRISGYHSNKMVLYSTSILLQ